MPPVDRKWFVVFAMMWVAGCLIGMVIRFVTDMGWPEPTNWCAMVFCGLTIPYSGAAAMRMVDDYFERKIARMRNPERFR